MQAIVIASYTLMQLQAENLSDNMMKDTVVDNIEDALKNLEQPRDRRAVFNWAIHRLTDLGAKEDKRLRFVLEYAELCKKHGMFIVENDFLEAGVREAQEIEDFDKHIQFLFATLKA